MSAHQINNWLVGYDICDPKRLARVFKLLKREGVPIQYSVFYVMGSVGRMQSLMTRISHLIDVRKDDVRAYRIGARAGIVSIGQPILPTDVWYDPDQPFVLT